MKKIDKLIEELSEHQKEIIQKASEPGSTILFNIKGMIQVLHEMKPFDFVEMGYQDIELLKEKGLIDTKREMKDSHILQGEEYTLSTLGKKIAKILTQPR